MASAGASNLATAAVAALKDNEEIPLPKTDNFLESKTFRVISLFIYMAGISGLGMTLAMYYLFIWDSRMPPLPEFKHTHHIEKIAIRLINSSEVTAEQFYKHILEQYRKLNHLQLQRQQFLLKQHRHLKQLGASGNKFQEVFATATIIQTNKNDRINKPLTPTNGTFLFGPMTPTSPTQTTTLAAFAATSTPTTILAAEAAAAGALTTIKTTPTPPLQRNAYIAGLDPERIPILDTLPSEHIKRKVHRKHQHNRHSTHARKSHKKLLLNSASETEADARINQQLIERTPLNPPATILQEPYTPIPIPLILNSKEDKRPYRSHMHADTKPYGLARKRTAATSVSGYETAPTYLNPFLTGELIFEK